MKNVVVSLPQLGLIAGTRGMLGAGLGLLLADQLPRDRRRAVGWTLVAVGALTTIPLLAMVIQGFQQQRERRSHRLQRENRMEHPEVEVPERASISEEL